MRRSAAGRYFADEGQLLALLGGKRDVVARGRAVYATFCSDFAVLGDVGHGQVGKAINNLLLWITSIGLIEAGRIAETGHRSADIARRAADQLGQIAGARGLGPDEFHVGAQGHADRLEDGG